MRRLFLIAAVAAMCPALPAELHAQSAPAFGTAGGWGVLAQTEARFAESMYWNPALLALPDIKKGRVTALAIDITASADASDFIRDGVNSLGVLRGSTSQSQDWGEGQLSGRSRGSVLWFASSAPGFAIGIDTRFATSVLLPSSAVDVLAGDTATNLIQGDGHIDYSVLSSISIGRAMQAGRLPLLGFSWVGATGRFSYVHRHAHGELLAADASEIAATLPPGAFDRSLSPAQAANPAFSVPVMHVSGGRIFSADLGLVSNPFGSAVISITATNVYQKSSVAGADYARRHVYALAEDEGIAEYSEKVDPLTLHGDELQSFSAHVESMQLPRVLRAAVSMDLQDYRIGAGGAWIYSAAPAIGANDVERWGVTISKLGGKRPRLFVSSLKSETIRAGAGLSFGSCAATNIGVTGEYHRTAGIGFGLSFSHVLGANRGC